MILEAQDLQGQAAELPLKVSRELFRVKSAGRRPNTICVGFEIERLIQYSGAPCFNGMRRLSTFMGLRIVVDASLEEKGFFLAEVFE